MQANLAAYRKKYFYLCIFTVTLSHICAVIADNEELKYSNVANTEHLENDDQHDKSQVSNIAHSRQKRYVYINTQSPVNIGFLIAVPYTFALPRFNLETSRRLKRSVDKERDRLSNLTAEEISPSESYDEPAYSIELARMSAYFNLLEVDEDICQQRLICEIFADPENHMPLSDMFAKKLLVDHGPVAEKYNSRYYRYIQALQEGVSGGNGACHNRYNRCPYSVEDRIHVPALHFWTFLTNKLGIEIKDD